MPAQLKKYFIKTYGCQMNFADSERVAGWYEEKGWKPARKIEEADEIVIVSCSVRESADNRVFGLVNNLTKFKVQPCLPMPTGRQAAGRSAKCKVREQRIILTGCMLRYSTKWLKEKLPKVDELVNSSKFNPSTSLRTRVRNSKTQAYVPIMEGCNNFCSYCVVPYARGREKSRPFAEIVCEAEELAKRGYREITLLGQNVNSYQNSSKCKVQPCLPMPTGRQAAGRSAKLKLKIKSFRTPFAELLIGLHEIKGIQKISFLTSNPWDLDDEIIEAMSLPKIDRYLHLPVQSGDNEVLKRMNRKYTAKQYLKLIKKIRKKIPEIKIGTDVIVGFPGETEKQFQNTVDLCKKVGFVKAYIAMYSPRLQTAAFKLKDDVPYQEKKRRWKILDEMINGERRF